MNQRRRNFIPYALIVAGLATSAASPAAAEITAARAMSSVSFLSGTWHCTGDGPPEDDTYTFTKKIWRDADTAGGLTTGTFDVKRQKWVVFATNADGSYAVLEATSTADGVANVTRAYPPGPHRQYTFKKVSDTRYLLGKQLCVKT